MPRKKNEPVLQDLVGPGGRGKPAPAPPTPPPEIPRWHTEKDRNTGVVGYISTGCRHIQLYAGPHRHIDPNNLLFTFSAYETRAEFTKNGTNPREVALFHARRILKEALQDVDDLEAALRAERGVTVKP